MFLPRGIEHGYTIIGPGDARFLVVTTPAPDGVRGWDGFVGSFERNSELRAEPPGLIGP